MPVCTAPGSGGSAGGGGGRGGGGGGGNGGSGGSDPMRPFTLLFSFLLIGEGSLQACLHPSAT